MNIQLTVFGRDALTLASACHRQCEVMVDTHWHTASGLPEATRYCNADPSLVRLSAPARVLVEDILRTAVVPGANLLGTIQNALNTSPGTLNDRQREALAIIQKEINP